MAIAAGAAEPAPKFAPGKPAVVEERETKPPPTFLLKTDADLDALMAQGAECAATNRHGAAIEIFQGVIEKAEDRVVAWAGENPEAGTSRLFVPATEAARRALVAGSAGLRAEYGARFEGQAAAELAQAAEDAAAVARVAGRFPATVASQRARWRCGALLADAGDFAAAAAVWGEFLELAPALGYADADVAVMLAQQTVALGKSGQFARARATLARLEKEMPAARRRIGGAEQNVVEYARRTLAGVAAASGEAALPEAFAPTPRWRTLADAEFAPFVCFDSGRVFVRTLMKLACLEVATGKRLWELPAAMQGRVASSSSVQVTSTASEREVVGQQRFAMAATPEVVCYVENAPVGGSNIEIRGMVMFGGPGPLMPQGSKFAGSSQLTARDARDGRLRWRVGQGEGRDEFSRVARWISPPAIVGGRVFVVALHIQSYHLVCLDAADGRLLWRRLVSHRAEGGLAWQTGADLTSASALHVTAGRVLCLTNGGVLACFDQLTGEPRWFCQYGALVVSGVSVMPPARLASVNPILSHEQTAVILPADTDQIMAFDIATGRVLWRRPRDQQRFLAGIVVGKPDAPPLLVLGGTSAAGRLLDDGRLAWDKLLEAGAGRPVLRGGVLYAVTRSRGVAQIDALTGRELRASPSPAGEYRHLADAGGSLMAIGSRSLAALRSFNDAIEEMTRRVEAAPEDPRRWRERGELNLQSSRLAEAMDDLTKARALVQKARGSHADTDALLFRCCMAMAARDAGGAVAWLERAGAYATTVAARSERWLRIADAQESQGKWTEAGGALQQILEHEAAVWLDAPASGDAGGARLAGGRVLNRSIAAQRLEGLAKTHGRTLVQRSEMAARRRLAEAMKHPGAQALADVIAMYPASEAQEQAWLTLAARSFAAKNFDGTAEMLLWFLRAEPTATRRGDAALGVALAGIRSGRGGLARQGLALMEPLAPKARLGFGGVSGTAAELRRTLLHDAPSAPLEPGQGSEAGVKSGREVTLLPGAGDLGGGRLFVESRRFVRTAADGARLVWASAEVTDKRGALDASPMAGVLGDTVLFFRGSQAVALDVETGKLLWQERGVRFENQAEAPRRDVFRKMVAMVAASGRPASPGWRAMFVAGGQLFRVKASGEVSSVSPRDAEAVWSVRLPELAVSWAAASVREAGRYLVLVATTGGNAAENRVAVLDIQRGRLLAVWDVPKDWPEFAITDEGRVQLVETPEPAGEKK
jgi:outer membrane protein assembly factor BamB